MESFNGRTGVVVSADGDYDTDQITNVSGVAGATCSAALDTLAASIASLAASDIANDSIVGGATVKDALDNLIGLSAGLWVFYASWGTGAAPASVLQRFIPRTNSNLNGSAPVAEYPIQQAGTFLFTVTWRVPGTPLTIDSITIAIFINGVVSTVTSTIPPSTVSGQFSGNITVAAGDGVCVGLLQSGTQAQAAWSGCVNVTAVIP